MSRVVEVPATIRCSGGHTYTQTLVVLITDLVVDLGRRHICGACGSDDISIELPVKQLTAETVSWG